MKKWFFRLLGIILGLNVFTACYGPAPGDWSNDEPASELTDETKAVTDTESGSEEEGEKPAGEQQAQ
ncbi:MAG: hypothetical protein J5640_08040 [Bacteroidales bacterium]|nr:hypothetical protein [Bacteroidales bacterium]